MTFIFGEAEELRGLVASGGVKGMEIFAWALVNKSQLW
jgi:hypothetical protein